jgi:hypothetical protein
MPSMESYKEACKILKKWNLAVSFSHGFFLKKKSLKICLIS